MRKHLVVVIGTDCGLKKENPQHLSFKVDNRPMLSAREALTVASTAKCSSKI